MFSPTVIANFLACRHLTALNRAAAAGEIKKPMFADPGLELLIKLGLAHEEGYLRELTEAGRQIATIPIATWDNSAERTKEALQASRVEAAARTIETMRAGADVIYQAAFLTDRWYGRADFLRRVDKQSALGDWSYEVVETKLARSTKARAIIQLCFYSELVGEIQEVLPEYMHVVLGGAAKPEKFPVQRYLAYFRKIRKDFEEGYAANAATYPEPVEHCRICAWTTVCDAQWRKDDHLSLVANITRNQRQALTVYGTHTVAALAQLSLPPEPKVEGIKDQAFINIREQARLQVQGRNECRPVHELLVPPEPEKGLCALPPPSPGDLFLDFEGDRFTYENGLEFLFGVISAPDQKADDLIYEPTWAMNPKEEKIAFENFMAMVMERRGRYPDMHIYHYGAYEETALKRMAGQHSTCPDELDELLRGEVLVDMFHIVKQSLRASVESYSIKKLEPLYGYQRDVKLGDATRSLVTFQAVLAFGPEEEDVVELKTAIEGYNRDDCVSARRLRDWLEKLRVELEEQIGESLPRPTLKDEKPSENLSEYLSRVRTVEAKLNASVPEDRETWTEVQKATRLMADLLEWHRREDKSTHWEYFHRCKFSDEEFITERATLGGLQYVGEMEPVKKSTVHRYRFPRQDSSIERARELHNPKTKETTGDLHAIDYEALTIDIKRGPKLADAPHPTALIPYEIVRSGVMRDSLLQLGTWVAENDFQGDGNYKVARELLLRHRPRLRDGVLQDFEHLPSLEAAKQISLLLDHTVLAIQGPPGSGKTYTGAHMIVELVKQGKKVGVTAVSHKVVVNLLKAICKAATQTHTDVKIIQKCEPDERCEHERVKSTDDNAVVVNALTDGEASVAAGTVWLWSRTDMANSVDVLFVDEAGQMSLANVLAASSAAKSIVLLGDPQQLDQPQKGVHPEGAEASALSHLLNGRTTIPSGLGLFLAESWRLHPDICSFTSDVFYEGRLKARPENAAQLLNVDGPLDGTGLRFVPVEHNGNQIDSAEEVEKVAELVVGLLREDSTWMDKEGKTKRMTLDDILIVAPYNAQVSMLLRRLPQGNRVGTVDKFQGQEAPVVIYSMTTSTPEDAPRGMEFLYSSNRLNVATSRAQCVTVLVASPALFDVQCKTPRQMELANAFCRYLEMAKGV